MNISSPGGLNVEGLGFWGKVLRKAGLQTKHTVYWPEQPTHVMHRKSVRETLIHHVSDVRESFPSLVETSQKHILKLVISGK